MAVAYPTAARQLLRDTLLDAMRELIAEREWGQISMAEVARAAGVSRQTLYKEFGTRQEFAQAFVLREADRFLGEVETRGHGQPQEPGHGADRRADRVPARRHRRPVRADDHLGRRAPTSCCRC